MAIHSVTLANFKGIGTERTLELRPITVFVGCNSSGKSSCIHALAALSQTVKVVNDSRPLVLDDEFAAVHLGRFIEIIHSKSYQDVINLGIGFRDIEMTGFRFDAGKKRYHATRSRGNASGTYRFKCTKRTQEVHLDSAQLNLLGETITAKRSVRGDYQLSEMASGSPAKAGIKFDSVPLESAFFFSVPHMYTDETYVESSYRIIEWQRILKEELSKTLYLGPFRQSPLRRYPTRGAGPTEVGSLGESTITMLANETVQSRTRSHIKQIAGWLKQLGLAKGIEVARVGRSDLFDVSITLDDGTTFPLADLGYGLSQVLPVLTQLSFAKEGSTLLFEQPEIHLHTLAAEKLSAVFVETAYSCGATIVIETHSPQLVKSFVQLAKKKQIKRDDLIIYRVSRQKGESLTEPLEFDDEFDVYENWEKGISMP